MVFNDRSKIMVFNETTIMTLFYLVTLVSITKKQKL